mmetsp:Transcript_7540/g.18168  ORF Transcript_7540/g.18168 Transcript_7540/m.18168 type:complete len:267 (-) Transcript_7540:4469-5269(-)
MRPSRRPTSAATKSAAASSFRNKPPLEAPLPPAAPPPVGEDVPSNSLVIACILRSSCFSSTLSASAPSTLAARAFSVRSQRSAMESFISSRNCFRLSASVRSAFFVLATAASTASSTASPSNSSVLCPTCSVTFATVRFSSAPTLADTSLSICAATLPSAASMRSESCRIAVFRPPASRCCSSASSRALVAWAVCTVSNVSKRSRSASSARETALRSPSSPLSSWYSSNWSRTKSRSVAREADSWPRGVALVLAAAAPRSRGGECC